MSSPDPNNSALPENEGEKKIDQATEIFPGVDSGAMETIDAESKKDQGATETFLPPTRLKSVAETKSGQKKKGRSRNRYSINITGINENEKLHAGCILGENYVLQSKLGRGGMGEAWQAYDKTADRIVVIKLVPKDIQNAERAMGRIKESFQRVHSLQHQHICPVHQLGEDGKFGYFLVMKFIEGITLDEYYDNYMKNHRRFPVGEAAKLLWPIAKALDYAHGMKIIHRDIKPQNIMFSERDGAQLIDFGLAAVIQNSLMEVTGGNIGSDASGTMSYMAPEQWLGRTQDARTDQYGLAATVYELLSGHAVFITKNALILRECALKTPIARIENIPDHANDALEKALAKDRRDRFISCRAFIKALANVKSKSKKNDDDENTDGFQPEPVKVSRFVFDVDLEAAMNARSDPESDSNEDSGGSDEQHWGIDSSVDSVEMDEYINSISVPKEKPLYKRAVFRVAVCFVLASLGIGGMKIVSLLGGGKPSLSTPEPVPVVDNDGREPVKIVDPSNKENSSGPNGSQATAKSDPLKVLTDNKREGTKEHIATTEKSAVPVVTVEPPPERVKPKLSFLSEQRAISTVPSVRFKIKSLSGMVEYQVLSGDLNGALDTIEQCRSMAENIPRNETPERARSYIYIAISQQHVKDSFGFNDSIKKAIESAERISSLPQKITIFCDIALAQDQLGDERGGPETLRKGLLALESLDSGNEQRILSTREIASTQIKLGQLISALNTIDTISDPQALVQLYTQLAEKYYESGSEGDCKEYLSKAKTSLEKIEEPLPRVRALAIYGQTLQKTARGTEALKIIEETIEISKTITVSRIRDYAQLAIVELMTDIELFADAEKTALNTIPDREIRSRSLLPIVRGLVKQGDIDTAFVLSEKINHQEHHCTALIEIAKARLDSGNLESAKSLFRTVLDEANRITIEERRSAIISETVLLMCRIVYLESL